MYIAQLLFFLGEQNFVEHERSTQIENGIMLVFHKKFFFGQLRRKGAHLNALL